MTHHTDAERAEFEAWARGYGTWEVKRDDDVVLGTTGYTDITLTVAWYAVQAARRAPAVPVPQEPTSKQVVFGAGALLGQPENTADNRHPDWHSAVAKARSVYLAMLAGAPQPPEAGCSVSNGETQAAPVQLPEPQAEIEVRSMKTYLDLSIHEWRDTLPDGAYNIYTEQQLRELLAAHGIQEQST
ncbi:hypothetical protein [Comamonas aquatica]|uniref:hypothetical protein n=1 Tax=Comamonas aquatica TaxID=225991 RepID=UPI0021B0F5E7|nr:hypothetical protein [Comamonas aquatica]